MAYVSGVMGALVLLLSKVNPDRASADASLVFFLLAGFWAWLIGSNHFGVAEGRFVFRGPFKRSASLPIFGTEIEIIEALRAGSGDPGPYRIIIRREGRVEMEAPAKIYARNDVEAILRAAWSEGATRFWA